MPQYSDESRNKVLKALEEGHASERKIADRTGLSKTLVHLIVSENSPSVGSPDRRSVGTSEKVVSPVVSRRLTAPSPDRPPDQPLNPDSSVEDILISRRKKADLTELGSEGVSLKARNQMLEARVSALTQSLQAANAAAARGSVAGESVAGRPSLASLREDTWRRFAGTVIDLPNTALRLGRERTIELVAGTLLADLSMLALGPPPTPTIAKMRSATEHMISDRGKLAVMIGHDGAGRRLRTLFLQSVVKYYFQPSVQRLFEKSMETMLPSEMMGMMGGGGG